MSEISLDTFEQSSFLERFKLDLTAKLAIFNKSFKSSVSPENGFYGTIETVKDNGIVERIGKTEQGLTFKEYLKDGFLQERAEKIADGRWLQTKYDDNGTAYLQSKARYGEITVKGKETTLLPNAEIRKGNITTFTDAYGRPVRASVSNLKADNLRDSLNSIKKDYSYKLTDDKGDLIPKRFGGRSSPENIVPQDSSVNRGSIKQVENIAANLKTQGSIVNYEVKINYDGTKNTRPSSFEPTIIADGKVYDLPPELRKIYNSNDLSKVGRVAITIREKTSSLATKEGVKTAKDAAIITAAISTVDNVIKVYKGEISAQEAVADIAKDTGAAGAIGFVSAKVASAMSRSSHALISKLGGVGVPGAVIAFGIDSYDSVIDYAQGEISGEELAHDLGESAVGVAGSIAGAALTGAAVGSVVPGVGNVVGFGAGLVGGMVGYAVATGAYATAIEVATGGVDVLADKAEAIAASTVDFVRNDIPEAYATTVEAVSEGVNALRDKAEEMARSTLSLVENNIPDKVEYVKSAMNDFAANLGLPIHL
ncbi:MAG: DNA/RNA non-specific endonuclease [Synergistaceae bacterium]|jgi:hypothetical protein|nr:DNA/RNA non-specific endonuclease [Synergistaceae bacterium]